ncbi:MAG: GntR family transcriptional regulator [Clostridia bacterium]|nr:GntR family transcriptional regulator [Clostridia bacterium]
MNKSIKKALSNNHSLSNTVFDILREKILKGDYLPGEKIKESNIANELNVSRTPIREAFKQLEQEGLIENITNKGAFVIGFTQQDIDDMYEVRKVIEGIAMCWAIERINEEELKQLQEVYELMEFYTQKKDINKVLEINTQFHEIIYAATKSRFLSQILKAYQFYVRKGRQAGLNNEDILEETMKEHKDILDCFYSHDTDQGSKEIIRHLNNAKQRAESNMRISKIET